MIEGERAFVIIQSEIQILGIKISVAEGFTASSFKFLISMNSRIPKKFFVFFQKQTIIPRIPAFGIKDSIKTIRVSLYTIIMKHQILLQQSAAVSSVYSSVCSDVKVETWQ